MHREMHRVQQPREHFWQRSGLEAMLTITLVIALLAAGAVQWQHGASHETVAVALKDAVDRQLLLREAATSATAGVRDLLTAMAGLHEARHTLEGRRREAALGAAEADVKRLDGIKAKSRRELQRIHADIELARKDLMELAGG